MIPVPLSHIHPIRSSPQLDHAQHAHQSQGSQQAKRLPLIRVSISRSATANSNQDPIQTDQTWAIICHHDQLPTAWTQAMTEGTYWPTYILPLSPWVGANVGGQGSRYDKVGFKQWAIYQLDAKEHAQIDGQSSSRCYFTANCQPDPPILGHPRLVGQYVKEQKEWLTLHQDACGDLPIMRTIWFLLYTFFCLWEEQTPHPATASKLSQESNIKHHPRFGLSWHYRSRLKDTCPKPHTNHYVTIGKCGRAERNANISLCTSRDSWNWPGP